MKIQRNKKLNNDGFTLIELLVALAISGVVVLMIAMFMTNGTQLYTTERGKIDLQNELQMADSFLIETLMEAKTVNITNKSGNTVELYTGLKDASKALLGVPGTTDTGEKETGTIAITTERVIQFDTANTSMYINKKFNANPSKGSLVSDAVKSFNVKISDECITYKKVTDPNTKVTSIVQDGYKNPIILEVGLTISDGNKEKTDNFTVTLRNDLEAVVVDGMEYSVK